LCTSLVIGQKVTLTPTVVNGANFAGGSINLGSTPTSTISLVAKVEIPANVAVGDNGTIKVYFSKGLALGGNVATGGDAGTLYFGGGKVATKSFVINLNWTDFLTAGGFIYAEYKSGVSYNSSNISVIKNSTMNDGTTLNPPADAPNPTKIVNTLCCNQTIRLGDKPAPITGSQYLNPYKGLPFGINSQWTSTTNGGPVRLDDINRILYFDYTTELKNIVVNRKLGYVYGGEFPNKSNDVVITVVPTPILRNTISAIAPINSEGFIELSSIKKLPIYGYESIVNLKVLQDPFYIIQPRDPGAVVDSYKWEYTKTIANLAGTRTWTTIPNENSPSLDFYDPSEKSSFEDNYYLVRRISSYQNINNASEPIKVLIRGIRYDNTICCDQTLKILSSTDSEKPQTIIGSTPIVDSSISDGTNFLIQSIDYQWQVQSPELDSSPWSDIPGATSKDYLPTQALKIVRDRRGSYMFELSYKYRRVAKIFYKSFTNKWLYGTVSSFSNETSLEGSAFGAFMQLYPNPTSSILNIECTVDVADAKLTISNVLGNIVNSNNFSIINSKLISVNVTNFPTGTYFITIENQNLGRVQRTFIKQ
ncbi:MAG: T9SS type A sorting domain-containing protein, partial [Flavobacterium sp.]